MKQEEEEIRKKADALMRDFKEKLIDTLKDHPVEFVEKPVFDIDVKDGGITRAQLTVPPSCENSAMRVEGYFKLFEIESLLRNVCFDTFEPLRERMHKD